MKRYDPIIEYSHGSDPDEPLATAEMEPAKDGQFVRHSDVEALRPTINELRLLAKDWFGRSCNWQMTASERVRYRECHDSLMALVERKPKPKKKRKAVK